MKIFVYAMREFDELHFFRRFSRDLGFEYDYTTEYPSPENASLAEGYDAVNIITNPLNAELLKKYRSLGVKYIATRTIGYDHIDVKSAYRLGMRVSHVTYAPDSVADYAIMLMLMASRKMIRILEKARLQDFSLVGKLGKNISQCTVGVIGTGRIGETVMQHLQGFGCRILAYSKHPGGALEKYGQIVDLDTLYRESDIISLHIPGTDANRHLLDREAFQKMKDGVILVNTARGMLVDTPALIEALETGKVGYAALDTVENDGALYYHDLENRLLADHDRAVLSAMPNVLLSPHMAFYTEQSVSEMVGNSVKSLLDFEKGGENPLEVAH